MQQISPQLQNESANLKIEYKILDEQIDRNKYYKELIDNKIEINKIIKVPIIFAGKEPHIIPMKNS